jgi:hypothetical protein
MDELLMAKNAGTVLDEAAPPAPPLARTSQLPPAQPLSSFEHIAGSLANFDQLLTADLVRSTAPGADAKAKAPRGDDPAAGAANMIPGNTMYELPPPVAEQLLNRHQSNRAYYARQDAAVAGRNSVDRAPTPLGESRAMMSRDSVPLQRVLLIVQDAAESLPGATVNERSAPAAAGEAAAAVPESAPVEPAAPAQPAAPATSSE